MAAERIYTGVNGIGVFYMKQKAVVTVQPSYSQKGEFEKIFSGSYPQKKRGTA